MDYNRNSERIEFIAENVTEDGKDFIRIEVPVKKKGFTNNFFVHFRKKGTIQWQSSPLIRNSNTIDMHGLDPCSVYEIRVAVLSLPKDVTTTANTGPFEGEEEVIETKENKASKNENRLLNKSDDSKGVDKFAVDFTEQVLKDVLNGIQTKH